MLTGGNRGGSSWTWTDGCDPIRAPMTQPQLARPLGLRIFNRAGGAMRRVGIPLVELEEGALVDRARRLTGLSDLGDPFFREPLRVLLDSLESEAQLNMVGRVI